ncbi:MAG TPA: nucleotide sugar dehydrogenase [Firmicutes bacterium]|nr:nucleotide sugar dehydrogenase [Bacillota bacterium]
MPETEKKETLGVIGLGYVGLPLALNCCEKGYDVIGIDRDEKKIRALKNNRPYLVGVSAKKLGYFIEGKKLIPTVSYEKVAGCTAVFICVSTFLDSKGQPDHTLLLNAVSETAARLKGGSLLVVESTVAPGTTEKTIAACLHNLGLKIGKDIYLAFSPERIDPGNKEYNLTNIPKLVGGVTPGCLQKALALYASLGIPTVAVSKPVIAEIAKILENTYRDINIALANETAKICAAAGVDVWEVIKASATKPFGFKAFYPGIGVGGSCIPKDAGYYIAWALSHGTRACLAESARQVNESMPFNALLRVEKHLAARGKQIGGSRVLLLGVTYKENVGDMRGSPALALAELLLARQAVLFYHDPYIEALELGGEKYRRESLARDRLSSYDCVILAVPHSCYEDLSGQDFSCTNLINMTGLKIGRKAEGK